MWRYVPSMISLMLSTNATLAITGAPQRNRAPFTSSGRLVHIVWGEYIGESVALLLLIRAFQCSSFDFLPRLGRLLMCKSSTRTREPQERGGVQMRCRGRARVTAGPCGPGTAPKMGVPGGASIDSRGGWFSRPKFDGRHNAPISAGY